MLGYTFRHQLVVTVVLLTSSAYLFISLLFSCLFIMLFNYPMFAVILLLFCAHCLYIRAVLFTHTLTRSLSDDPEFARPDIGCFVSIVQVFDETVRFARSWILSPFLFWYSYIFLFLLLFFDSCISHLASISFLTSFEIMCSLYMYYCSDR